MTKEFKEYYDEIMSAPPEAWGDFHKVFLCVRKFIWMKHPKPISCYNEGLSIRYNEKIDRLFLKDMKFICGSFPFSAYKVSMPKDGKEFYWFFILNNKTPEEDQVFKIEFIENLLLDQTKVEENDLFNVIKLV